MEIIKGQKPLVLAYGIRWSKELWIKEQNYRLPEFQNFQSTGVYIFYWKGHAGYIGIAAGQKLEKRIPQHHKGVRTDWDSFSWFVVDSEMFLRDIEKIFLRSLTRRGPGQSRRTREMPDVILEQNRDGGGFKVERHDFRGYWLDAQGRLTVARESSREILTEKWRKKCRLKRQRD